MTAVQSMQLQGVSDVSNILKVEIAICGVAALLSVAVALWTRGNPVSPPGTRSDESKLWFSAKAKSYGRPLRSVKQCLALAYIG